MSFRPVPFLFAIGFAGFGLYAGSRFFEPHGVKPAQPTEAPLLEQVQALGELHSVKYTYRDVHEFSTTEEPSEWLAVFPGSEDLVHAATRNSALMSYTGTVEAGVDLSRAKVTRRLGRINIVLPEPKVYPTNITAQVYDIKRGWVWRDVSIATSAIEDAKIRFRETSLRQGIVNQAKTNAQAKIAQLSHSMSNVPVTVTFTNGAA